MASVLKNKIQKFLSDPNKKFIELPYEGPRMNSACSWTELANPVKLLIQAFLMALIFDKLPPSRIKNFLYKLVGVKVGKDVVIGPRVMIDPLFPQLITIKDGAILGWGCRIHSHEFTVNKIRLGRVIIGEKVLIGCFTNIRSGVTIGKNAMVGAMSFVNKNVNEGEKVGGVPAKKLESKEVNI